MLYVLALRQFGAGGAAMIWRRDVRGTLVRLGDSARADLRLPGAGAAAAELFCDGGAWNVRVSDGVVAPVRDGGLLAAGAWTVMTLVGDDDEPLDDSSDDVPGDAAGFEVASERADVRDGLPALLGSAPWCALRLPAVGLPVAAVVRRPSGRRTMVYPVPGVTLRRAGRRVAMPVALADGDELRAGSADAPAIRYSDPREELERLLGELRDDPPPEPAPRPPAFGEDGFVTVAEAVLWAVGAATAVGYVALVAARW